MKLTKAQRESLRGMYGGRCAYCGRELGAKWHADHVEPVERELTWKNVPGQRGGRLVATGRLHRPQNDRLDNLKPACVPCNIDKHSSSLEGWRRRLSALLQVLQDNHSAYRHALRFGFVEPRPGPVVFYFERARRRRDL